MTKFSPFDSTKYLDIEEAIVAYLEAAAEGGDPKHFARALGTVARSPSLQRKAAWPAPSFTKRFPKTETRLLARQ